MPAPSSLRLPARHPLRALAPRQLGPYRLQMADLKAGEKSGWSRFSLRLADRGGRFEPAVILAVYSAGGRRVSPWVEVLRYEPELTRKDQTLDLRAVKLEEPLFAALAKLIPPGGHLMVSCETPPHHQTYQALLKGVPPAATPLGQVLFRVGLRKVKFFYLAEGGWEGQQKLWAEKPLNRKMEEDWDAGTARELKRFLAAPSDHSAARACVATAKRTLQELHSSQECGANRNL